MHQSWTSNRRAFMADWNPAGRTGDTDAGMNPAAGLRARGCRTLLNRRNQQPDVQQRGTQSTPGARLDVCTTLHK